MKVKYWYSEIIEDGAVVKVKCSEFLTEKVKKKSGKSVSVENGVLAINTENESDILIFWNYESEKWEIKRWGICGIGIEVSWITDRESEREK